MKKLLFLLLLLPIGIVAQIQTTRTEAQAKALADSLYERLTNGEDFSFIVTSYSEDIASSVDGGMVGYMKASDLVKEYAQVMVKTPVGQISKPFKTQFGYHILQVVGKRGKEYNSRQILIKYN